MAPTKSSDHGALFDRFPAQSESVHGGNLFDEGFSLQSLDTAHDRLFDLFGASKPDEAHGQRYDTFGWRELPRLHGTYFDEDFDSPTALTDGEHSSWYDVFSPGTGVRYISQGQEVEGIVSRVERDHAIVRTDGGDVQVGLSQFLAYRSPSLADASPDIPASGAQAPSAASADAHGGTRTAGPSYGQPWDGTPQGQSTDARTELPSALMDTVQRLKMATNALDVAKSAVELPSDRALCSDCSGHGVVRAIDSLTGVSDDKKCRTCQGRGHNHVNFEREKRKGAGVEQKWDSASTESAKTSEARMNITKEHIGWDAMVKKLIAQGHSKERAEEIAGAIARKKYGPGMNRGDAKKTHTPLSNRTPSWSRFGGNDVLKAIDVAETAIQGEIDASAESGATKEGSWCPGCREVKKAAAHCPTCGTKLVSKTSRLDDLAKAFGAPADPLPGAQTVTDRPEDKNADGKTGEARNDPAGPDVPERAHKASDHHEDGTDRTSYCPHCGEALALNDERTEQGQAAHKCIEGTLDVLKSLVAA